MSSIIHSNGKKRILYIESNVDGTIGGSHFSLLFLVEGLDKKRYAPVVLFYQKNQLIPRYEQAGARVLIFKRREPVSFMDKFPFMKMLNKNIVSRVLLVAPLLIIQKLNNYISTFIFESFNCWRVIVREKIDLIHLNNTLMRPQEWILASLFTKAGVVAHERGINTHFPFQIRFWAGFLKAIICISGAVKSNLVRAGFPEVRLFKIYNAVDPEKYIAKKSRDETLRELGVKKDNPVVGIVGNIKEWKGQEVVVRAVRHVREEFPGIKCLMIGGTSEADRYYLDRLKEIIEKERLDGCIMFLGQRNDIPDLINALDVLIHASILPEPFGRVLLEGMALQKPVITTAIGAGPEIVEDGVTGIVVPPSDDKKLSEAVVSVLKDPAKATEMGKAGRRRLDQYFHISENVKRTEDLYSEIIR